MWQRFTEQTKRIVFYAQQEAIQIGPNDVAAEHLLLGLLREVCAEQTVWPPAPTDKIDLSKIAAVLLSEVGVDVEQLEDATRRHIALLGLAPNNDVENLNLLPSGKWVIDMMYEEAQGMQTENLAPEFMLLALGTAGTGATSRLLARVGFDLEAARQKVAAIYLPPKPERLTPPPFWSRLFVKKGTTE